MRRLYLRAQGLEGDDEAVAGLRRLAAERPSGAASQALAKVLAALRCPSLYMSAQHDGGCFGHCTWFPESCCGLLRRAAPFLRSQRPPRPVQWQARLHCSLAHCQPQALVLRAVWRCVAKAAGGKRFPSAALFPDLADPAEAAVAGVLRHHSPHCLVSGLRRCPSLSLLAVTASKPGYGCLHLDFFLPC